MRFLGSLLLYFLSRFTFFRGELFAEEKVQILSLLWLTLFVQIAHLSIRAVFVRAAVRSLNTEDGTPEMI